MKPLTETEVRARIRAYIDRHHGGNQASAAREWGYSRGFVNLVLAGEKNPTVPMLRSVGIKKVCEYRG